MLLATLVEGSSRVANTPGRLAKTALIADLLREARAEEIEIVTAYLSGRLRQGRIGLGWASFQAASEAKPDPHGDLFAAEPDEPLAVLEVDEAFERLSR